MGKSDAAYSLSAIALIGACMSGCLEQPKVYSGAKKTASSDQTQTPNVAPPPPATTPIDPEGAFASMNPDTGVLTGFALDRNTLTQPAEVELYLNAPYNQGGTLLIKVTANQPRQFYPAGNYGFTYQLAAQYMDGKMHRIYGYALDTTTGSRVPLANSPGAFYAGTNSVGLNFFNSTVRPALIANCSSCHSTIGDYTTAKYNLANPSQFSGGSATNNEIYNKIIGNISHGGGVRCSFAGSPCAEIRAWWPNEFN
jgi:hypothetical protein